LLGQTDHAAAKTGVNEFTSSALFPAVAGGDRAGNQPRSLDWGLTGSYVAADIDRGSVAAWRG
jgi:hypothetical protein